MKEMVTPEINREFINRLNDGEKYIIEQIANLKGELASIKLILGHLTSISSGANLRITALETKKEK